MSVVPLVIIVIGGALILVAIAAIAVAASSRSGGSWREQRPHRDDNSGLSHGCTTGLGSSMMRAENSKPPLDASIGVDSSATTLGPAEAPPGSSGGVSN